MRIDVPAPDAWGKLSERYRAFLPKPLQDPGLNVLVFNGAAHAVTEVTKSLSQLYAHKKTIAVVTGVDPSFESVAVAFSQDEFQVKLITPEEAKDSATWAPLMDELLFVLVSEDDPITGRLIDISALTEAMKGKRVFKILVSHELHNWRSVSRPEPFGIQIVSLSSERALLIGGERCRIQPQLAPALYWKNESDEKIKALLENLNSPQSESDAKQKIENFESQLPSGFKPYFKSGETRLFDRTLFSHPDFDGLAIIEELGHTLQTPLTSIGQKGEFETTSSCRWESPRFQDWLVARGETEASVRGLVIVSEKMIDRGLATHLETAAKKIDRLQKGT